MPLIYLSCKKCKKVHPRIFMKIPNYKSWGFCSCGGEFLRQATGPTSQVKESLDNGVMQKSIERYSEAERLAKERAKANPESQKETFV